MDPEEGSMCTEEAELSSWAGEHREKAGVTVVKSYDFFLTEFFKINNLLIIW